jgi:signal peptidase
MDLKNFLEKDIGWKELSAYIVIIVLAVFAFQHTGVIVSGSMEPVLYKGDIVLLESNPSSIEVGDIIVYHAIWLNSEPVVHRVITNGISSTGEDYYLTKGDNNPTQDPGKVYPNEVISKVIKIDNKPLIIPKLGYINIKLHEISQRF